jgi:hypothetical protein
MMGMKARTTTDVIFEGKHTESVLANASESLSNAIEMLNNFDATLEPAHRKTLRRSSWSRSWL